MACDMKLAAFRVFECRRDLSLPQQPRAHTCWTTLPWLLHRAFSTERGPSRSCWWPPMPLPNWKRLDLSSKDGQRTSWRSGRWLLGGLWIPSGKLTWLWKITIFNGKTHYKWQFSIAMLVYQRVIWALSSGKYGNWNPRMNRGLSGKISSKWWIWTLPCLITKGSYEFWSL